MSLLNKLSKIILTKVDAFVIKYLTVERGRNKRKWIWKTRQFRDITQLYIPRGIFTIFVVIICWKINERIKVFKKGELYYNSKSLRQAKVEHEMKQLDEYFNLENEFDPDSTKSPVSVEPKNLDDYEYNDLTDDQIKKLDEFDDWIKRLKKGSDNPNV